MNNPPCRTGIILRTFFLTLVLQMLPTAVWPQTPLPLENGAHESTVEIPAELTPTVIDSLLSRLTDAEIRAVLHDELQRQAELQTQEEQVEAALIMTAQIRLSEMYEAISTRTMRWADRIANLHTRMDKFHQRLATAEYGVTGMLLAIAILIGVSIAASCFVSYLTRRMRHWLVNVPTAGYWNRLMRTLALGLLELLPILTFTLGTQLVLPFLRPSLGPLTGMAWIYTIGIWWSWIAILISRRIFAPDAQKIRITTLKDATATSVHSILRRCVQIGLTGWLLAGLFVNLGFGFPPALVTVALSGIAVIVYLLFSILRNISYIRNSTQFALDGNDPETDAPLGFFANAMPWVMSGYILIVGAYWLLHWLERGQHRLYGPLGTLIVFLILPIFDRMGTELINTVLDTSTAAGKRFRDVLQGTWRSAYGTIALFVIFRFWGINLIEFTKGENAPVWASAGFDIVITIMIGYMIWCLIKAALYSEARTNIGAEDADPDAPPISRLDTLMPLFRNVLLGLLAIIVLMILLSAIGIDIGPLIASAGIVGIAIGFGAQTLVRDIFSGIFFLVDDAFRVGEYIELDKETRGEVESISIRSLKLRHHKGAVITIPFGELQKITNHNREWVIYKMSFRVEPDTDPLKFKKLVKVIGAEFMEHPEHGPKFIEPLKSQGVYYVDDDSALVMRIKFKCLPRAQFVLRREIYHRLRTVFAENDIYMARRKVEVVSSEDRIAGAVVDEALKTPSVT